LGRVRIDGASRDSRVRTSALPSISVTDVYASAKGRTFGAWIDEAFRVTGAYSSGDLIENPAYIIESIWRDELNQATADIDYASIDPIGHASIGLRKDWKFARSLNTVERSDSIVSRIAYESFLRVIKTADGKRKLVALDTNSATPYVIEQDQMSRKPLLGHSHQSFIRNQFNVGYAYNYATGAFEKSIVVDETKSSIEQPNTLITNGTFETADGWTTYNLGGSASFSVSGGVGTISVDSANNGAYQTAPIQFISGRKYRITMDHTYGGTWKLRLPKTAAHDGTVIGGSAEQTFGPFAFSYEFTATETATAYFFIYCSSGGSVTFDMDDVVLTSIEFDYTSFTPNESDTLLHYGGNATTSLCGVSQTRYGIKNRMEENLLWVYDDATANLFVKKMVEWRYAPHLILDIAGWWGDTASSTRKPLISYEHGDQCYVDHPLLDSAISNTIVFMVTNKIIYKQERLVRLVLTSMR
jgi:hypothetical protein